MNLNDLFKDGIGNHASPLPARKSLEVLPGVYSWDPSYLAFQRDLSEALDDKLPPQTDDELFVGKSGVHTGFDRLRSVAGYSMNPISYVPVENASYCRTLGLPGNWRSERHRKIAENVWRLVFSKYKASNINLPKHSTSGFSEFTYDAAWKRDTAIRIVKDRAVISKLSRADDMIGLARDHGVVNAFNLNKRDQVESPTKKRVVFTRDYALGRSNEITYADKRVVIDGKEYPDFTATRSRVVQGGPWPINFPLQVVATGHLYSLFEAFPKTFHHVDNRELCDRFTQRGDVALFDVSDYDRSIQDFMYDTKFAVMREFWDEWLVHWAERFHYAPYYTRPLDVQGKTGCFVGNPFNPAKQVHCGNRSGDGSTSLDAKTFKVIDTLTLIDDHFGDVLDNEERYLNWEMTVAIANNGDDEGITGPREHIRKIAAMRLLETKDGRLVHGYFRCSLETGQVFSGDLIHRREDGSYVPIRRIHTMLEKTLVPERGIGGVFRKFWYLGITDRVTMNEGLPAYNVVMEELNRAWRQHLQREHGTFWGLVERAVAENELHSADFTSVDKAVLYDHSKLFYQYSDADVSPDVLAMVVEKIKFHEVEDFVNDYYRGLIC